MIDLNIIEVRNQLLILKIAHDEGFCDKSLFENLRLCDEYDFRELLFDTNITLLKNIFSEIVFGNVEYDYEELEIFHEFIDSTLGQCDYFDREEMSYYIFMDPSLDKYFSLVEKARLMLTKEEFTDFKHGDISGLGVAMDYIQTIEMEAQAWNFLRLVREDKLYWLILLHYDYDFALSTDLGNAIFSITSFLFFHVML